MEKSNVKVLPQPLAQLDDMARAVARWGGHLEIHAPVDVGLSPREHWHVVVQFTRALMNLPEGLDVPKGKTEVFGYGRTLVEALDALHRGGPQHFFTAGDLPEKLR